MAKLMGPGPFIQIQTLGRPLTSWTDASTLYTPLSLVLFKPKGFIITKEGVIYLIAHYYINPTMCH